MIGCQLAVDPGITGYAAHRVAEPTMIARVGLGTVNDASVMERALAQPELEVDHVRQVYSDGFVRESIRHAVHGAVIGESAIPVRSSDDSHAAVLDRAVIESEPDSDDS